MPRRDVGRRRRGPRGNTEISQGYRVNPDTNQPELWCAHCERFRHTSMFKAPSYARTRRTCSDCERRLAQRPPSTQSVLGFFTAPYGGKTKVEYELWHYLKRAVQPTTRLLRGPGRPCVAVKRATMVRSVLGSQALGKRVCEVLHDAVFDHDKLNWRNALWLCFRRGVLSDAELRLTALNIIERMANDAKRDLPRGDPLFDFVPDLCDEMRMQAVDVGKRSRQRLEDVQSRIARYDTELCKRESRNDYLAVARQLYFSLTALRGADAVRAADTVCYEYVMYMADQDNHVEDVLQDVLAAFRQTIAAGTAAYQDRVPPTEPCPEERDELYGTFWQQTDHPSFTRFLVVTDAHKDLLQLCVLTNEDNPDEVGTYVTARRIQFVEMGPSSFSQFTLDDILEGMPPSVRVAINTQLERLKIPLVEKE